MHNEDETRDLWAEHEREERKQRNTDIHLIIKQGLSEGEELVFNSSDEIIGKGYMDSTEHFRELMVICKHGDYSVAAGGYEMILNFSHSELPSSYFRIK